MSGWRDNILKEFDREINKITIVSDPDELLLEEVIAQKIQEAGFEVISFEDSISFRHAYESRFRYYWDRGLVAEKALAVRIPDSNFQGLPYDVLREGRRLFFSLGEIFPSLSSPVIATLDPGHLDSLYEAVKTYSAGKSGDKATKDFIMRHVFEVAPEIIKTTPALLRMLLERHYRWKRVPETIDSRLEEIFYLEGRFTDWPLHTLLRNREDFFAFLQERWPIFLDKQTKGASQQEIDQESYRLRFEGPVDLPFEHDDVRVIVDNLFVEGLLKPVRHKASEDATSQWYGIGILKDRAEDDSTRASRLIKLLEDFVPDVDASHDDWLGFAPKYAELVAVLCAQSAGISKEIMSSAKELESTVDERFKSWLVKKYGGLATLPAVKPAMVHHIPRFMAGQLNQDSSRKLVLIVIDGLSLDQWLVIRNSISDRDSAFTFRENWLFAWAPTLTPISRQAIFAGKHPGSFLSDISSTSKEPNLWTQFWANEGIDPKQVLYCKDPGQDAMTEKLREQITPKTKVVGIVINKVDDIMHGMEMGRAGMHNQVKLWAETGFLEDLLHLFADEGFRIFLTSDHGNIEAAGCGGPSEGVLAEIRGERVRLYKDAVLRQKFGQEFPNSIDWKLITLGGYYFPLIAPARYAFISKDKRTVGHGGICLEEMVVPFVEIIRGGI